ncbi:hypothetical protein [Streptococcus massiliensis]|nr:hypothetical protein [Streptococcus massiliensis]
MQGIIGGMFGVILGGPATIAAGGFWDAVGGRAAYWATCGGL